MTGEQAYWAGLGPEDLNWPCPACLDLNDNHRTCDTCGEIKPLPPKTPSNYRAAVISLFQSGQATPA